METESIVDSRKSEKIENISQIRKTYSYLKELHVINLCCATSTEKLN